MKNMCYPSPNGYISCDSSQTGRKLSPLAVAILCGAQVLCVSPTLNYPSSFDMNKKVLPIVSKCMTSAYDESSLVVFTSDYKEAIPLKSKVSHSALRYKGTFLGVTRDVGKLPIPEITESVSNGNLLRPIGKVTTTIKNNGRLPIPPIY